MRLSTASSSLLRRCRFDALRTYWSCADEKQLGGIGSALRLPIIVPDEADLNTVFKQPFPVLRRGVPNRTAFNSRPLLDHNGDLSHGRRHAPLLLQSGVSS